MPFGVWFSRHRQRRHGNQIHQPGLHCLSAFGSVVTEARVREMVTLALGLHCLSAFGSVVTLCMVHSSKGRKEIGLHCLSAFGSVVTAWCTAANKERKGYESPLPFGVWFSRHLLCMVHSSKGRKESPLPFGVWFSRHENCGSAAGNGADGLHCLSAFGSVVTQGANTDSSN